MSNRDLVVGLDIGTTKVCAVIGEYDENGILKITGVARSPCTGLRKGVVVNIESTLKSITQAIEAAELMSGQNVDNCWVGIGGSHIEGIISRGVVAVSGKTRENHEISPNDVERVLEAARALDFSMDRFLIDVIPQTFIVDGHSGIKDPKDMIGIRLECEVNIITCSRTSAQNLINCVNRSQLEVNNLILQTLAAGRAVLTEEEKELGVAIVDMGAGTTSVLTYKDGNANSIASIPAGGNQVTSDISIVKNISVDVAERIKVEAGCCWAPLLGGKDENIVVQGMGGRVAFPIPRTQLLQIINPRIIEIFQMVREKIAKHIEDRGLGGGIVLTGGGANLEGVAELAAEYFHLPVRVGNPISVGGLVDEYRNPAYATAVGLVLEGAERSGSGINAGEKPVIPVPGVSLVSKAVNWIKKEFF